MTKGLELKLADHWPTWFNVKGDIRHTLMPLGFQHGDGWFQLLWRLCEDLEPLVAEAEKQAAQPFEVLEVKEKFGGLRFYVNHCTDAIFERIQKAEAESHHTCEVCGQPGKRRENGWIKTRCDEHADTIGHQ
jgi:hypothetical protein